MDNNSDDISPNLFLLVAIIMILVILNCIILFQDFYSSFLYVVQVFWQIVSQVWKFWADREMINSALPLWKLCFDKCHYVDNKKATVKVDPAPYYSLRENENILAGEDVSEKMTIEEVKKLIMEKMRLDEEKLIDDDGCESEDEEISLEELKKSFAVFDENEDGFIDARELRSVLLKLELTEFSSEEECKSMIRAFDVNGDGMIDFDEFVTLLEQSFS